MRWELSVCLRRWTALEMVAGKLRYVSVLNAPEPCAEKD